MGEVRGGGWLFILSVWVGNRHKQTHVKQKKPPGQEGVVCEQWPAGEKSNYKSQKSQADIMQD